MPDHLARSSFSLKLLKLIDDTATMEKVTFEEAFEIYLFTANENDHENNFSKLNEFLSFLKFNKVSLPYKFAYVGRSGGLIPELTLNQNILIDWCPNSLTEEKEFQFQKFLTEGPNRELEKLYKKINLPHEFPSNVDAQMRKLCGLIKSLIFDGQFIFLEEPENDLGPECIQLFIDGLKTHVEKNKLNIFIFSHHHHLWSAHAHRQVTREKDFSFTVEKIKNIRPNKQEKMIFYAPLKIEQPIENQLHFKLPSKLIKKNSAA